jgi:hypothetical protein
MNATAATQRTTRQKRLLLYARSRRDVGLWLLLSSAAVVLCIGLALRGEHRLVPDRGAGYALGILGLAAMTALLAYSVRKRLRVARRWGRISTWFRVHMALGIAGPVAILLHCNFRLGSTNANVALACVLAVSSSGVVGRLLYGRIHSGLFGRRLSLIDLRTAITESKAQLGADHVPVAAAVLEPIDRFERVALAPRGLVGSTLRLVALPFLRRRARSEARARLAAAGASPGDVLASTDAYLDALARASVFVACERLFALWHVVHLPLCVVLFLAAAVHVVAVHVY